MKIVNRMHWKVMYLLLTVLALALAIGAPESLPW